MSKIPENIQFYPEKCSGCQRCALSCSFDFTGSFNPSLSYIMVDPFTKSISFSDDCIECGLCADACVYDALKKK